MNGELAVTAIVTAFRRIDQTIDTLRQIKVCAPTPDEILVHVDANETACAEAVRAAFPEVTVIVSAESVGPGGGRNRLVAAARNEWIASFDDDSYPLDADFFARAAFLMEKFPDAAVVAGAVFHRGEPIAASEASARDAASFGCGAAIFRRSDFLEAGGFAPLVVAYGMEEEDLALKLLDRGRKLKFSPWLRVYHDTDRGHHRSAKVNAGAIANVALLAYLRYPVAYWPYGALQVGHRVAWCLRKRRFAGLLRGLVQIPAHLRRHRHLKRAVSPETLRRRFEARGCELRPFDPFSPPDRRRAVAAMSATRAPEGK